MGPGETRDRDLLLLFAKDIDGDVHAGFEDLVQRARDYRCTPEKAGEQRNRRKGIDGHAVRLPGRSATVTTVTPVANRAQARRNSVAIGSSGVAAGYKRPLDIDLNSTLSSS